MRAMLVLSLVLGSGLARAGDFDRIPLYFLENEGQAPGRPRAGDEEELSSIVRRA